MLSVLVVGGGPTGVEFAGELSDLVKRDLTKLDPERAEDMRYSMFQCATIRSQPEVSFSQHISLCCYH